MESGSCDTINTLEDGYENGRKLAEHVGCPGEDQLECLRGKSGQELASASGAFGLDLEEVLLLNRPQRAWLPHVDGRAFKEVPIDSLRSGNYNQVPCMAGSTKDEFKLFFAAKSFVSALVGIAIEDGLIKSVDDPITDYAPRPTPLDRSAQVRRATSIIRPPSPSPNIGAPREFA